MVLALLSGFRGGGRPGMGSGGQRSRSAYLPPRRSASARAATSLLDCCSVTAIHPARCRYPSHAIFLLYSASVRENILRRDGRKACAISSDVQRVRVLLRVRLRRSSCLYRFGFTPPCWTRLPRMPPSAGRAIKI